MLSYNDITNNILYSGKTYSTSSGSHFDICENTTTDVLQQILDYLDTFEGNCNVKVNESDEVCGFLEDKIISSDSSVTITSVYENSPLTPPNYVLDLSVPSQVNVLFNRQIPVITSIASELITSFSYTLLANTLKNDGDILEIETSTKGSSTGGYIDTAGLRFGGIPYLTVSNNSILGYRKAVSRITRISINSIKYENNTLGYDSSGILQPASSRYASGSIITTDLSSTDINLTYTINGSIGQTANNLIIKYFAI